ncbi:MAG TPA: Wzy polymerase domain-containing protein [Burkholderiales bacterium]|nr:Wzy polymerase domain-containing protein [Burkholderiales bacterium]
MDAVRTPFLLRLCLYLCGLMVTVPFLFPYHYFPFPTFYTEWIAFAIGLAALGAIGLAPIRHAVPVPAMSLGLFAFTAVLALQVALGLVAYPLCSAMGALYSIWAALIVMLGAWLGAELGEKTVSHSLQWWFAVVGTMVAASGFLQLYHTPLFAGIVLLAQPLNAMFGLIGQPNNFADYLGIALLSVALLHSREVLGAVPACLMALLIASGMALSGSRTSWVYIVINLVFIPLLLRRDSPKAAGKVLRVAAFAFVVFSLVQVLNLYTDVFTGPEGRPYSAGERFVRYLWSDNASGGRIRAQLFLNAWLMFLSNPILGVGFGEYGWRGFELSMNLPGPVIAGGLDRHSHNLFLQLLGETGIAGFLCVAVPLALWLYQMPWRQLSPARCWVLGVLAIIGVHSMLEFPLWHASFLGVFALLLGLASPAFAAIALGRLRRGLFLVVVVAGCLAARSVWSDYRAFEEGYLKLEARSRRGGPIYGSEFESLIALQEKGSFFSPYFDRFLSEAMELDERGVNDKLAFNTQALRVYPAPSLVRRQIVLLALAGRDGDAARTLRGAVRIYPEWTREWLPELEALARERPAVFAVLLASARAQLGESKGDPGFAPLPGKR